ncbi:Hypothetical predicted protein, partial [Paramuricea clavata]
LEKGLIFVLTDQRKRREIFNVFFLKISLLHCCSIRKSKAYYRSAIKSSNCDKNSGTSRTNFIKHFADNTKIVNIYSKIYIEKSRKFKHSTNSNYIYTDKRRTRLIHSFNKENPLKAKSCSMHVFLHNKKFGNSTSKCAYQPKTANQEPVLSCKHLLQKNGSLSNGIYKLKYNDSSEEYPVYCHMTAIPGCGGGGWTLVMKVDGNKNDFNYTSSYWTNKMVYAVEDGLEGMTEKQTKLASYWNTPFNKICLGMKVNGARETKWIVVDHQAWSLFNEIADGIFKSTTAGKVKWKSLIDNSSLQKKCNKEGFNFRFVQAGESSRSTKRDLVLARHTSARSQAENFTRLNGLG